MSSGTGGHWARESPIGRPGRVVVATRGDAGPGEVELEIRGCTELFVARSDEPLQRGTAVLCVSATGPRSVVVVPWDDPRQRFTGSGRQE